jgi:hypothetical protein
MPGQVGRSHQRRRENEGLPKGLAVYPLTSKTSMVVGCSKAFSTRTTARLRRNRDATPLVLPPHKVIS